MLTAHIEKEGAVDRIGNATLKLTDRDATHEAAASTSRDETLAQRIRKGLRSGEFGVAFQPVVRAQTLQLLNVECLLRWQHPEYGLLLPECFVSAFEDRETAREVTEFMLESVCLQLGEMRRAGQALAGCSDQYPAVAVARCCARRHHPRDDAASRNRSVVARIRTRRDGRRVDGVVDARVHALLASTWRADRA